MTPAFYGIMDFKELDGPAVSVLSVRTWKPSNVRKDQ
jgi:hypothetical protein